MWLVTYVWYNNFNICTTIVFQQCQFRVLNKWKNIRDYRKEQNLALVYESFIVNTICRRWWWIIHTLLGNGKDHQYKHIDGFGNGVSQNLNWDPKGWRKRGWPQTTWIWKWLFKVRKDVKKTMKQERILDVDAALT